MELPLELHAAIESELSSQSAKRLARLAAELSKNYRSGTPNEKGKFLQSQDEVLAYAAFRLPATYAAIYSALAQIKERTDNWCPKTVLDVGAGPGTGMWASLALWPEIEHVTLLEREKYMIELGKRFSRYSSLSSIQNAEWKNIDITNTWDVNSHDLVIASYVLNELPQEQWEGIIRKLWESTKDKLIIIEPGTPAGFLRIKQARELLMSCGVKTIAPCPHNQTCDIGENDWCHFSKRVSRSRLHRIVKGGELSYEDEKFTFVCMSQTKGASIDGIVIRHPQIRKGHIQLELCTPDGLKGIVVTRKSKEEFRKARKLKWGSIL